MPVKFYFVLLLLSASDAAFGQSNDGLERQMMKDCQVLAKELTSSNRIHISAEGIKPVFSWHAGCAERPPTGPGNVTALCEGKQIGGRGKEGVFFWQKALHGKFSRGFFLCTGQ